MMLVSLTTETLSAGVTEDPQPTPKSGMWCWPLSSLCAKCNSDGTMRA